MNFRTSASSGCLLAAVGSHFHLQIMTFSEISGGVVVFLLGDNVISRGGGGSAPCRSPFQEQAHRLAQPLVTVTVLAASFCHAPAFITVYLLHPQQQAQTWRAGARIFINHAPFLVAFHQLLQAFRRVLQLVFCHKQTQNIRNRTAQRSSFFQPPGTLTASAATPLWRTVSLRGRIQRVVIRGRVPRRPCCFYLPTRDG